MHLKTNYRSMYFLILNHFYNLKDIKVYNLKDIKFACARAQALQMEKSQLGLQKQSSKAMVFYKGTRWHLFAGLGFSLGHTRWMTWRCSTRA